MAQQVTVEQPDNINAEHRHTKDQIRPYSPEVIIRPSTDQGNEYGELLNWCYRSILLKTSFVLSIVERGMRTWDSTVDKPADEEQADQSTIQKFQPSTNMNITQSLRVLWKVQDFLEQVGYELGIGNPKIIGDLE